VNGQVTSNKPTSSSSASSTTSTSSSSSSSTGAPTSSPTAKSSSNTGAIAGGVVGGIGGLALIIGALWFFLRRRKTAHPEKVSPLNEMDAIETQRHEMPDSGSSIPMTGKSHNSGMTEVAGTHELPTGRL
jgi:LPXTG-motif cell wall-anchored protein